ncbi:MAG: hypothetical protein ACXVNN_00090 [Bacteroidia bacterium]
MKNKKSTDKEKTTERKGNENFTDVEDVEHSEAANETDEEKEKAKKSKSRLQKNIEFYSSIL